jgi:DNA-binding transcriptional MerR regulator
MNKNLLINDISKKLGMNSKTIRFYEDIGLIPKPERNESNYRIYTNKDIETISFVKKARNLGFTIDEIKNIIKIRENGDLPRDMVINTLEEQKDQLEKRIDEMIIFKEKLSKVIADFKDNLNVCQKGKICGLIELLLE